MTTKGTANLKVTIEATVEFDLSPDMTMTVTSVQANAEAAGGYDFTEPVTTDIETMNRIKVACLDSAMRYISHRTTEKLNEMGPRVLEQHLMTVPTPRDPGDLN